MVGRVTFRAGGEFASVTLGDDGRWAFPAGPAGATARAAAATLAPYGGPADGPFGVRMLDELADRLGGRVALEPKAPQPPGTVY
jgi:hypothetical protein